jgi:PhnB protein
LSTFIDEIYRIFLGGDRHGQIVDPSGHRWGLARHVRDVLKVEIVYAAAEMFGS